MSTVTDGINNQFLIVLCREHDGGREITGSLVLAEPFESIFTVPQVVIQDQHVIT